MKQYRYRPDRCMLCGGSTHSLNAIFHVPVSGENTFGIREYYRELWSCDGCGLFTNQHNIDLKKIYIRRYRESAYSGSMMMDRYNKIMDLSPENSDNRQRVERITSYIKQKYPDMDHNFLDIGSGMAVFPAVMSEKGWAPTVIDPDPLNIDHAKRVARANGIQGYFPNVHLDAIFPLITFNKVLEHTDNIIECLSAAKKYLSKDGIIYIELPDGESAIDKGSERQEFFLEHYYIFSCASIALLVDRAGYVLHRLERILDPSGKFTLSAFIKLKRSVRNASC